MHKKNDSAGFLKHKNSGFWEIMHRLCKNKAAMFGLVVFALEVFLAILAPIIAPYDPAEMDYLNLFKGPSAVHWFGTDDLGRDIFSRILIGSRFSLTIGVVTVFVSAFFGISLGSIAGYFGGKIDNVMMRILDIVQAIPGMLLTIAIAAVLGAGFFNTILALSIGSIAGGARLMRASILKIRNMEYLESAEAINCSRFRIILQHTIPNAFSPQIVAMTMGIASTIVSAAGLSFVGLGVQPPNPEWGAMLSGGRGYMMQYPHLVIFPGLAIMITVLALNLLGDGLRDAMDPRLKD